MKATISTIDRIFREKGVVLTIGAEPTCVPVHPEGAEWSYAATGPTKLGYARKLARALLARDLRGGVVIFAPGKLYPGEVNPRWALHVAARRDGQVLWPARRVKRPAVSADASRLLRALCGDLALSRAPQRLSDPLARSAVWVLPLDHDGGKWSASAWTWPPDSALVSAEGPAGLRLPWDLARGKGLKRALTVNVVDGRLQVFLPPLLQETFVALLAAIDRSLPTGVGCDLSGYMPEDTAECWRGLVIAADPGVLEINLPPCAEWQEYDAWLRILKRAQKVAGLVTWKLGKDGRKAGTGAATICFLAARPWRRTLFSRGPDGLLPSCAFGNTIPRCPTPSPEPTSVRPRRHRGRTNQARVCRTWKWPMPGWKNCRPDRTTASASRTH